MILVSYVECDVPGDMTLRQWRRVRAAGAPCRSGLLRRLRHALFG